ncbi:MAG: TRAP transporter small permease subunit [candidate division NC10 bacterium]
MSHEPETASALREGSVTALLRGLTSLCMVGLLILVSALILLRVGIFSVPLEWSDEVIELLFAWMVFIGTAIVWGRREHIVVDLIPQMLAGTRAAWWLEVVGCALALVFLAVFTWQGATFTLQARGNTSPILILPRPLWYVSMPIAGMMMTWHTLRLGLQILRRR